jgi:CRISPR-associated protein Cas2
VDHGQRVQNSVFECVLDAAQFRLLKDRLLREMDPASDSLRFYVLGNQYKGKVEHFGAKPSFDVTEPLVV